MDALFPSLGPPDLLMAPVDVKSRIYYFFTVKEGFILLLANIVLSSVVEKITTDFI